MRVYHRTSAAVEIIRDGFRDGEGTYMTHELWTGVWISSVPLDENEGAWGSFILEVEIPESVFEQFEWVEEGKGYRESLVPAETLNAYFPSLRLVDDEEAFDITHPGLRESA